MHFSTMGQLCSKEVVKIESNKEVDEAVTAMLESDHRSIVIVKGHDYHILTANDLIDLRLSKSDFTVRLSEISLKTIPQLHKDDSVLEAVELVQSGFEYIAVVSDDRELYGLATNSDLVSSIDPETLMENYRLKDFFKRIAPVVTVGKEENLEKALMLMSEHETDCVIVVENEKPIGIITTKDSMEIVGKGCDMTAKVKDYCSSPLEFVDEGITVKEALKFIKDKHYKRVVAVDKKGKLSGIILQRDLIASSYSHWAVMMKSYQSELLELNAALEERSARLQKMATTDMLTQLYNRHMFSELFSKEHANQKRYGTDMVMMMVDIDHFKAVNDSYGHDIGDEVLKETAATFIKSVRSSDIVARWGGEEFIFLLTNTPLKAGEVVAEKIRRKVEELKMSEVGQVTVSIGLTEAKKEDSLLSAYQRADRALYNSKKSGRNRVAAY